MSLYRFLQEGTAAESTLAIVQRGIAYQDRAGYGARHLRLD